MNAIRQARDAAELTADLVELRLDSMERPDAAAVLADRRKPAIVTCRPTREGGMFEGSEEERLRILTEAHAYGAEFIDIEWDTPFEQVKAARRGRGIIVSRHDFAGTPADTAGVLEHLRASGGEVAKLAVTTQRASDLLSLLTSARAGRSSIVIGMGAAGMSTRILAEHFGSRWTYAGPAIAPGQITVDRLVEEFHFRRIRSDAAVYGVLGRPVALSLSPAMHNAGFAALDVNAAYVPLEPRDLDGLRAFAESIGVQGLSVTIPFKRDVMPLLDDVAPAAASAGAVNTITIRDGRWVGTNTDTEGFLEPLLRRMPDLVNLRAIVLGAGGAARAVAVALRGLGAAVGIAARRGDEARTVAHAVGADVAPWPPKRGSWDLLVNATPVGSRAVPGTPFDGPFDGKLVYDLVYDPDPTPLVRAAETAGCPAIGGLEMLVAQAERQFEIWTGQRPVAGLFAQAAKRAIKNRSV